MVCWSAVITVSVTLKPTYADNAPEWMEIP
jgi:hypothetical protein